MSQTAVTAAPLTGVRVLETGDGVGAAFCAHLLHQLGARVTKVVDDAPAADLRSRAERTFLDRGKAVVPLSGDAFAAALADCDIVVRGVGSANGTEGRELRAEYEAWRRHNTSLIFVAATPFGASDAFAGWRGGDLEAQAITGWPNFVGMPDEAPLINNYGGGGLQHGICCAGAALAALNGRRPGGPGEFVDVSEADTVGACIRLYSHTYRLYNIPLKRAGLRAPGSSGRYPHAAFPCKDGVVSIICRTTEEWERFVEMIGRPEWTKLPRYQNFYEMATQYPDEVDALLEPWLMARTKAELSELAVRYKVPLASVRTVDEALDDEQMAHREFFTSTEVEGRTLVLPGFPVRWEYPEG